MQSVGKNDSRCRLHKHLQNCRHMVGNGKGEELTVAGEERCNESKPWKKAKYAFREHG